MKNQKKKGKIGVLLFPGIEQMALQNNRPRLAEVSCSRIKFEPGDRILVRTHHKLTQDEQKKLKKSIEKWAGEPIEVLIVNLSDMDISIEHRRQGIIER